MLSEEELRERTELQSGVHGFVTTWYEGLKLKCEGVELGRCLEYQLSQMLNEKVLAELREDQS